MELSAGILQQFKPGKGLSLRQVTEVLVKAVGLFFKHDIEVGLVVISVPDQVNEVIKQVQEVKGQDEQLQLLL